MKRFIFWFKKLFVTNTFGTKPYSDYFPKWFWNNRWIFLYCFCSLTFWSSAIAWKNIDQKELMKLLPPQRDNTEVVEAPLSDSLKKNFKKKLLTPNPKTNTIRK